MDEGSFPSIPRELYHWISVSWSERAISLCFGGPVAHAQCSYCLSVTSRPSALRMRSGRPTWPIAHICASASASRDRSHTDTWCGWDRHIVGPFTIGSCRQCGGCQHGPSGLLKPNSITLSGRRQVRCWSQTCRRPASSCDRPNSSSLQVCDQLRTCLWPDSVMEFGL